MPVVKISGIPSNESQENLSGIRSAVLMVISRIYELRLLKSDITVFFPKDMMTQGLGEQIIIEIFGMFPKAGRTQEAIDKLAKDICVALKARYPNSKVKCFIHTFNPSHGYYCA